MALPLLMIDRIVKCCDTFALVALVMMLVVVVVLEIVITTTTTIRHNRAAMQHPYKGVCKCIFGTQRRQQKTNRGTTEGVAATFAS